MHNNVQCITTCIHLWLARMRIVHRYICKYAILYGKFRVEMKVSKAPADGSQHAYNTHTHKIHSCQNFVFVDKIAFLNQKKLNLMIPNILFRLNKFKAIILLVLSVLCARLLYLKFEPQTQKNTLSYFE